MYFKIKKGLSNKCLTYPEGQTTKKKKRLKNLTLKLERTKKKWGRQKMSLQDYLNKRQRKHVGFESENTLH